MCLAYAYPVAVNNRREVVYESHSRIINQDTLTCTFLSEIVGDAEWSIYNLDDQTGYELVWNTSRFETDQEMADRICRAESYNKTRAEFLQASPEEKKSILQKHITK